MTSASQIDRRPPLKHEVLGRPRMLCQYHHIEADGYRPPNLKIQDRLCLQRNENRFLSIKHGSVVDESLWIEDERINMVCFGWMDLLC